MIRNFADVDEPRNYTLDGSPLSFFNPEHADSIDEDVIKDGYFHFLGVPRSRLRANLICDLYLTEYDLDNNEVPLSSPLNTGGVQLTPTMRLERPGSATVDIFFDRDGEKIGGTGSSGGTYPNHYVAEYHWDSDNYPDVFGDPSPLPWLVTFGFTISGNCPDQYAGVGGQISTLNLSHDNDHHFPIKRDDND